MTIITGQQGIAGPPATNYDAVFPGSQNVPEALGVTFNADGTITETYPAEGVTVVTTFNADGTITAVYTGTISHTVTTTFNPDGSISESIV